MSKRKQEDQLEMVMHKIRKLERRMKRRHRRRHRSESLSESEENIDHSFNAEMHTGVAEQENLVEDQLRITDTGSEEALGSSSTTGDVLLALGDLMPDKAQFGTPINNDVARVWSTILKGGLAKEPKLKLMEQLIPENCALLKAPKLNPEIATSTSSNIVNRDKKIEVEQNQLGVDLAVIANALILLINNDSIDKLKIISLISDAGRILTDLHFMQTRARKNLILPGLDKKFIEIIKDIDKDEYLYGNNLLEKIKLLKTCQRSGQSVKKTIPAQTGGYQGNSNISASRLQSDAGENTSEGGHGRTMSSVQGRRPQGRPFQSPTKPRPNATQDNPHTIIALL